MLRVSGLIAALDLACGGLSFAQTSFGVPDTGNAQLMGAPVQIEDCVAGIAGSAVVAKSDGRFKIVFTNEGRVAADLIRFRIDFGGESLAIRDVGTFTPGVTITHVYSRRGGNVYLSPLFAPAKMRCGVEAVHFKDGSEWSPGAAAADAARAASMKPIGSGFIGVQMEQTPQGVVVRLLNPGGPARVAGMMQGDVLERIDDQHVGTVADAITLISSVTPGQPLKITVLRDEVEHELKVIVGRRPQ